MSAPEPTLDEQIAAVQDARDYVVRSIDWRAGRRGFDPIAHRRQVARLEAAIETLKRLREPAR